MYIRFPIDRTWRGFLFKRGLVYGVGPRLRRKFVDVQGAAEEVQNPEDVEAMVPDPGGEVPSQPPEEPLVSKVETPAIVEIEVLEPGGEAKISHKGGPWYDVLVDGEPINEQGLRKADAEILQKKLNEPASTTD